MMEAEEHMSIEQNVDEDNFNEKERKGWDKISLEIAVYGKNAHW
jgi:hypothetical protein